MTEKGNVIDLDHVRAASKSAGYKSGRNSERETPEILSTAITRSGGTSSHCDTACMEIPSGSANPAKPPTASIALFKASLRSVIARRSSMALPQSQAQLHCTDKVLLYPVGMTIGNRIRIARLRLKPKMGQEQLAAAAGVSKQAVYDWEKKDGQPSSDKVPAVRKALRVTFAWLLTGEGPPPDPDSQEVRMDDWMVTAYQKKPSRTA